MIAAIFLPLVAAKKNWGCTRNNASKANIKVRAGRSEPLMSLAIKKNRKDINTMEEAIGANKYPKGVKIILIKKEVVGKVVPRVKSVFSLYSNNSFNFSA